MAKKSKPKPTRYWVSWWSGNYADEGCTKPPFQFWTSGERDRADDSGLTDCSLCAVIDAPNEEAIRRAVLKHFPDASFRFVNMKDDGWNPGERFAGFQNRTRID